MIHAGQGWICDSTVVDPEELVTTQDMQDRYGITATALRAFIRRNNLSPRGRSGNSRLYRLGDILAARANSTK
jgi:hypothetical protein